MTKGKCMPDWLEEITFGHVVQALTALAAIGVVLWNFILHRKSTALQDALASEKLAQERANREKEDNQRTKENYNGLRERCKDIELALADLQVEKDRLTVVITELHNKLSSRPCLVRRGLVYVHAFPEEGEESFCYCAECLEKDRVITRLTPTPEVPCSNGKCPKHRRAFG